ncbi:MAG TPA: maleylpyruvate isomerase N-terminal domain-containing protein [Acidimicrobiales bacterium]|nr:maleylpyruvate isomerase N-terminal domain-containing protein [Acidimicrobiales bacterium]
MLSADVGAGFGAGLGDLPLALRSLRRRQPELYRRLDADDWERKSRCHLWTVHDVVRHVRDGCRIHVDGLRHGRTRLDREGPFDPRETPLRWLEETALQTPTETVAEPAHLYAEEAATASSSRRWRRPGATTRWTSPSG